MANRTTAAGAQGAGTGKKIKHFQGYGIVNAKKLSNTKVNTYEGCLKQLVIKVWGNHEYGLERDDTYDVYNWLVKKFDKSVTDYRDVVKVQTNDTFERIDNLDVEVCVYTIYIKCKD